MGVRDRLKENLKTIREALLFILGVVLIADAVFGRGSLDRVIEITVGLVLVGLIPIDYLVDRFIPGKKNEAK